LDKLNWSERNYSVLTQLIGDYRMGRKYYDDKKPPYAVLDWDQTLGNHDHFWTGLLPPTEAARKIYTQHEILNLGNVLAFPYDPLPFDSRGFFMGSIDGTSPLGDILGIGAMGSFATPPKVKAADPNRRSLLKEEWINEFFNTSSNPAGHGFRRANAST
jgi:hypothetical protein